MRRGAGLQRGGVRVEAGGGFGGGGGTGGGGGNKRDMDAIDLWFADEDNDGTMGGSGTTVFAENSDDRDNNQDDNNDELNTDDINSPFNP